MHMTQKPDIIKECHQLITMTYKEVIGQWY